MVRKRMFPRVLVGLGFTALALSACSSSLPPLPPAPDTTYRLGPGDQVRVITFGEDKLTAEFRVSDNGTIAVPLLGNVRAAGLTPNQLGSEIQHELDSKQLLHNASVSVEVLAYRPIFVLGEVTRPGQYPYQPGMTVVQAVSVAGGYTYRAVTGSADIVRSAGHQDAPVEGSAARNSLVEPGDVITIEERMF